MPALIVLVVLLLIVSLALTTWRALFPRPAAPTYICVYVTERGTVTGVGAAPWPCVPPAVDHLVRG